MARGRVPADLPEGESERGRQTGTGLSQSGERKTSRRVPVPSVNLDRADSSASWSDVEHTTSHDIYH